MTVALLALLIATQPPRELPSRDSANTQRPAADRWIGDDKVKHFFVSGFTMAGGFSVARLSGVDRRSAIVVSAVPTAAIAVGKELYDRRAGRPFSFRDLAADVLGAAAYALVLARTTR